ncbi:hypothetical protein L596_026535 [Steinernema carpocapsae]|uniref:Uncharacterized protein n=1 Tax=Steinernema carpocapsae TaxID=34508 RepID=A0A4U5M1T3_STECR|nr:hypothetical protein L596_026535 [Steinernema carpocapsae]
MLSAFNAKCVPDHAEPKRAQKHASTAEKSTFIRAHEQSKNTDPAVSIAFAAIRPFRPARDNTYVYRNGMACYSVLCVVCTLYVALSETVKELSTPDWKVPVLFLSCSGYGSGTVCVSTPVGFATASAPNWCRKRQIGHSCGCFWA